MEDVNDESVPLGMVQESMENWMYQFLKVNTLAQCIHV